MAGILRGEIYWADLEPVIGHEQGGRRPVLILSRTLFNNRSGTVVAMALTSVEPRAGYPLTLELANTALPKRTWAKISQVRTLSTQRLAGRITACDPLELQQVVEGLNEILGRS